MYTVQLQMGSQWFWRSCHKNGHVAKVEIHHLDQERGLNVFQYPNTRLRYTSYLFCLVPLAPFFAVPSSSAVPGYCRASSPFIPSFVCRDSLHSWVCCHRSHLGQQRAIHRFHEARQRKFPVAVLLFAEGCRLVQPCNFVRHRHCPDGSNRRLTPERLVLRG